MIEKFIRWCFSYYWNEAYRTGWHECEGQQHLEDIRKEKK